MLSLPVLTWIRFFVWLAIGLVIYFLYSVRHSKLRRGIDTGHDGRHSSADHQDVIVRILPALIPLRPLFRDDSNRDDR